MELVFIVMAGFLDSRFNRKDLILGILLKRFQTIIQIIIFSFNTIKIGIIYLLVMKYVINIRFLMIMPLIDSKQLK